MQEAFAKLVKFYAFLGPFAPFAALATVGVSMALISQIPKMVKMQSGGLVPGSGFGDRVPAMLEPGERVVNRQQYAANAPAIESAIRGGGTRNNYVTIHADKESTVGDMLRLEGLIERLIVPAIERALDEGRFRPSYGLGTA
jgi:hypothetical protein